jgi:protein-disulfide isomerase
MLFRAPLIALVLAGGFLGGAFARSIAAEEITPEQRKAIEAIIHDYLMQNPDVLIDALREAEAKASSDADVKAAQVLRDRRPEVFDDPATPVGGNPQGDVTIVEFFDYRCPYCKQVHPAIQKLLDQDPKLRFVYKEFPVLGEQSDIAAHAALAARLQGRYEPFHNAMMAAKGQITEELVYRIAGSIGLDVDRLKRDMTDPEIDRALSANRSLAKALELRGTPGFVIGDHVIPGAVDLDALKTMVADARKQ